MGSTRLARCFYLCRLQIRSHISSVPVDVSRVRFFDYVQVNAAIPEYYWWDYVGGGRFAHGIAGTRHSPYPCWQRGYCSTEFAHAAVPGETLQTIIS